MPDENASSLSRLVASIIGPGVDRSFRVPASQEATAVKIPAGLRIYEKTIGKLAFINPRRYGAMTWHDHVRCRLSVFTREDAQAIVAYLECKRDADSHGLNTEAIKAALDCFWRDRPANGPTHQAIRQYRNEEAEYLRDIARGKE